MRREEAPAGYYPTDFELGHRPPLDGLRGVAVLYVLIGHGPFPWFGAGPGVVMFFTLSGFLITALLLEERRSMGRVSLPRFYARRALRLLPALAVCLAFVAVVVWVRGENFNGVTFAALYVANLAFAVGRTLPYLSHTWSLSLEEQFYVAWPLTLLVLARSRRRWPAVAVAAGGAVVCAGLRILMDGDAFYYMAQPVRLGYAVLHRADALLVGCLLALVLGPVLRLPRRVIAAAGVVGVVVVALAVSQPRSDLYQRGWFTAVPYATAAVMVWLLVARSWLSVALAWAPLRYVGRISYGLYLWHFPIFKLLDPTLSRLPDLLHLVIASAVSLVVAAFSFRFVEQPFLRLKGRFAPGGPAPAATPAEPTRATVPAGP